MRGMTSTGGSGSSRAAPGASRPWSTRLAPAVAARAGGGLVGWYRQRAGLRNDVLVRGFSFDGERFAATGEERLLNPPDEAEGGDEHAAAPYGLALAHVGDGVFLVVWSEGRSPDFRLRGRFVRP